MSMPESYRHTFIAQLHNAMSGFTGTDVDEAVRFSEQAKTKCVGITIETRPDYCLRPHLRCASAPRPGVRGGLETDPFPLVKCSAMDARGSRLVSRVCTRMSRATRIGEF